MRKREEDRLRTALDKPRTVEYEGSTYSYQPRFEWGTGDFSDTYPVLVLTYNQEVGQRDADQPMNDLLRVDEKPNDPTIDRNKVSRVRDVIQVTLAADTGRDDNGVPWHIMVQQTSISVWEQIRFELDFNTGGPNGNRPMNVQVGAPPSGPTEENGIIRSRFDIALDYNFVHTDTVDAVAEAETDTNVTQ